MLTEAGAPLAGTNHTKSRIAAASSLLIYVKSHRSETQRHASRSMQNGIEPSEIRPRRLKSRSPSYSPWERNNAQVDRYRRLRLTMATSAQAMTPAPIAPPDDMVTEIAVGLCGPGRTRINGVCVARTTVRQTRRAVRRCVRWNAGVCAAYQ